MGAIAARLSNVETFGTGPLAELRRLDSSGPLAEPTLHRLLAPHKVPEDWLAGAGLRRWALLTHTLALAAPHQLVPGTQSKPALSKQESGERRFGPQLGRALFEAGLGERCFVDLLEAGPEELLDRLPRAIWSQRVAAQLSDGDGVLAQPGHQMVEVEGAGAI